jgi:hypothetical protein
VSYALDVRDFHLASEGRRVIPVLVATAADSATSGRDTPSRTRVIQIGGSDGFAVADQITDAYRAEHDDTATPIDPPKWENAPYRPVPTIIQAAEELFAGHSVKEISHSFATNLDITSHALVNAIRDAQANRKRTICFVTGIPGAGKTLTGLNAVHDPAMRREGRPAAVFLSGNGPLVKIVRAALVRDQQRKGVSQKEAMRTVATFIGNVHGFIKTYGLEQADQPPYENAIVWDEAQRAWNRETVAKKQGIDKSEPELVLEIMERAPQWSVIVALVGGGQEIHDGEAGLEEWGRALAKRSTPWNIVASPEALEGGTAVAGHKLFESPLPDNLSTVAAPEFHLKVSVRSPRARRIGEWVNSLLMDESPEQSHNATWSGEFPLVVTRDLHTAKNWLREHTDNHDRCGLLASSGALRLRADGLELSSGFRGGYSFEDWFLGGRDDTRSSHWLEVAASEFECQGLELDWTAVCWGGDFVRHSQHPRWNHRRFVGAKWQNVRQEQKRRYIANKYRVLLTRARKGMIIWVPRGSESDATNDPTLFSATALHLAAMMLPCID